MTRARRKTVADADVLIDFLAGAQPVASRILCDARAGRLVTTAPVAFELWKGAWTQREQHAIRDLLHRVPVLQLDAHSARLGGALWRHLADRRQEVGAMDTLTASICLVRRMPLLTRNREHFERVPGLELVPLE